MKLYPFYSALSHLYDFHGIEMDDDEYENIAFHAYAKIGNKRTSSYTISGSTTNCEFVLPCNADVIEMVTTDSEDYQSRGNIYKGDITNASRENRIERDTGSSNGFLYTPGAMVEYEQHGNILTFKRNMNINVLYRGEILDDDGLPEISTKEMEAIANYCAYTHLHKKGMATMNQATVQMAMMIKQEWLRSCADARTPEYLNQNDFNEILQAQHNWDRKRYNVSFKPLRK